MKIKRNICKPYRIAAALGMALVIGIYIFSSGFNVYANNIVITGDAAGSFSVTSPDVMLFDLSGLYPGDTSASSVTISNTDMVNDGFEVFMYASNTSAAEYDLGQITKLTVTYGGITLYDGMLIDFDESIGIATPISLGQIARGTSRRLDFIIEIDGDKADNNYQDQDSHFVVTFVANSYGPPGPAPTIETPLEPTTPLETPLGSIPPEQTSPLEPVPPPQEQETEGVNIANDDIPLTDFGPDEPVESDEPALDETKEFEEEDIPLDSLEPELDETIELDDDDIPISASDELPKTGERSLALFIIPGAIIICFGLFIILSKGKRKTP